VFDPGLGLLRAGFLVSRLQLEHFLTANRDATLPENARMGSIFALRAKTNSARKIPRRVGRTYSRWKPRVKANPGQNRPKGNDLDQNGEWRVANGE
jgi:hypothetical protein